ncbi:MAG TPA: molybdate ABC transporter substrate-binding protein, partial [Bacteroidota bacterium]|nr:molybdate ABC transporter substrate-binding protein [Bacteroidota bacterium]
TAAVNALSRGGFGMGAQSIYAYGALAIWRKGDSASTIAGLANSGIKSIAIANPAVAPYGAAAIDALKHAGIYDRVQSHLIQAENISQVNTYINTGTVDAALTSASTIKTLGNAGGRWNEVPDSLYSPIAQGMIVIKRTGAHDEAAGKFFAFVLSPKGRDVLVSYGYRVR